jgi:cell division transport system permease protein
MSLTESRMRYPAYDLRSARIAAGSAERSRAAPIVPRNAMATRSLVGVIAIMSFLASLTLGAVVLVRTAAAAWQSQVAREVTIQLRPTTGRDIEADLGRASLIARGTPGIAQVKPYTKDESLRLIEPWLGTGLALDDLPVPRLIVVSIAAGSRPDLEGLRRALTEQVPGASLDDHRGWVERMGAMTRAAVWVGLGILGLVMLATILLVVFATRGAMAMNHAVVEVLHFVGAKNRYIAGQFQRHFLLLGLKGATIGGGAAIALFLLVYFMQPRVSATAHGQEIEALFGNLALMPEGYAGIVGLMVLIAAVTAMTSRGTVHRTLDSLE